MNAPPKVPKVRLRWRTYGALVAAMQVGLVIMLLTQSVRLTPLHGFIVIVAIGALLIAFDQPVGRSIFIPAAIVQIVVFGFAVMLGLLAQFAAASQQSGAGARQAMILTLVSAANTVLLLCGLPMALGGFRRKPSDA